MLEIEDLFKKSSDGLVELYVHTLVVFEISWVLSYTYKLKKSEIIELLSGFILNVDFIMFNEKNIMMDAISIYEQNSIDFEDSYYLAYIESENFDDLKTFDKKLDKAYRRLYK